ncbi:hypothetical protein BNJ_00365 [Kaumoebavirus]|uniref:hypothetical protein n=1 Tax=Kaumoebavirus TaxID=1859492 RepID=UPI0009C26866|nr:hypothetical protein BNJ_00365 [Kaumoebavirus]ARA72185.1 hypothetical protein BNJ_00365 [Kaumoebavirus]
MSIYVKQLAQTLPSLALKKKVGKQWVIWSRDIKELNCIEIMYEKSGLDPDAYMIGHAGKLFKVTDKIPLHTTKIGSNVAHSAYSYTPRILIDGKLARNQRLVELYSKSAHGHFDVHCDMNIYMKLSENSSVTPPTDNETGMFFVGIFLGMVTGGAIIFAAAL